MPKIKEICQDCGNVFMAGPYTFFCPECRKKRVEDGKRKARLRKLEQKKEG